MDSCAEAGPEASDAKLGCLGTGAVIIKTRDGQGLQQGAAEVLGPEQNVLGPRPQQKKLPTNWLCDLEKVTQPSQFSVLTCRHPCRVVMELHEITQGDRTGASPGEGSSTNWWCDVRQVTSSL